MILDATTKTVEIILAAAVATNQLPATSAFVDKAGSSLTPGSSDTQSNGVTAVAIVTAPAVNAQRVVRDISILNADTVAATVTVRLNDNGTFRTLAKVTMAPSDTLYYSQETGWVLQPSARQTGAIGGGIAPSQTQVELGADFTITAAANTYQDTGLGVTLPDPGVYVVWAVVRCNIAGTVSAGNFIVGKLRNNTSAADIPSSGRRLTEAMNNVAGAQQSTTTIVAIVVTTTPNNIIDLFALREAVTATYTIVSDAGNVAGGTSIGYMRIGSAGGQLTAETVLGADVALTLATGVFQDIGLSISIPVPGTYLIYGDLVGSLQPAAAELDIITAKLNNATDAVDIANSERRVGYADVSGVQVLLSSPIAQVVNFSGGAFPKTIKVLCQRTFATTPTTSTIASNTNGRSVLGFVSMGVPAAWKTRNLYIANGNLDVTTPASQLRVKADEITIQDILATSVSVQLDITVTGANGLDTGVVAANTWYFVWLIFNPSTSTVAGLFSLSSTSPTMPAGYTKSRRVGSIRRGATALLNILQVGDFCRYTNNDGGAGILNNVAISATFAAASAATFVPPTATRVWGRFAVVSATGNLDIYTRVTGSTLATGGVVMSTLNFVGIESWFEVSSAQSVDWRGAPASGSLYIDATGYIDPVL